MARFYTREELLDFIGRIDSLDRFDTARAFLDKLYPRLPKKLVEELETEMLGTLDWLNMRDDYDGHEDYSPSAPWNAPGMKISDFISGVSYF